MMCPMLFVLVVQVGRSAVSLLCTARAPIVNITVLSDSHAVHQQLRRMLDNASCPGSVAVTNYSLDARHISIEHIVGRFKQLGIARVGHHSSWGGYAKLLVAELVPVAATLVVDTDTLFARDATSTVWPQLARFAPQQLLAARGLRSKHGCVGPPHRLNSGVMLLDLQRMRAARWVDSLLALPRAIADGDHGLAPCRKMVEVQAGNTRSPGLKMVYGDQEFISVGCMRSPGACGALPPAAHYDWCDRGSSGWAPGGTIYHFNCAAPMHSVPSTWLVNSNS